GLKLLIDLCEKAPVRRFRLEIDGRRRDGDYVAIEVMNTPLVGPGVPLAPRAEPDDGLLDVVLIGADERAELLRALRERLRGEATRIDLPSLRARRLRIDCEAPELHVDGSLWNDAERAREGLSLSIELRPAAVIVAVP